MAAVAAIVDIVTKCFSSSEFPCRPNASHRGGYLGRQNGTNLTVLNLHVSPMPPTKFQRNPTYCSGADVVSRFSRWWPSWILERNEFSNSKSLSHPNASHQVQAQSDLQFGSRRRLKIFKMATVAAKIMTTVAAILDIEAELF